MMQGQLVANWVNLLSPTDLERWFGGKATWKGTVLTPWVRQWDKLQDQICIAQGLSGQGARTREDCGLANSARADRAHWLQV